MSRSWMTCPAALAAVLALLASPVAATDAATPETAAQETDAAPVAGAATFAPCQEPAWAATAAALVEERGRTAEAAEIYRAVLARQPTNVCAVRGLAAIATREQTRTPAQNVGQQWAGAVRDHYAPLGPPLLAALGLLLVLLVVARLVTPLLTPPAATATWADRPLWYVGGVVLVGLASASPLGLAVLLDTTPGWLATVAALAGVVLVALAGVVLVARGRGRALRLRVEVRGSGGSADPNASDYLLARLSALGTRPPEGLEVPLGTDVTTLPADALTTLPDAGLAQAVFRVLQAVRPAVPWQVTVALHDNAGLTVVLRRNGRLVGQSITFTRAGLGLPLIPKDVTAADKPLVDEATRHLLTAAAAHVLLALSERHPQLRSGLAGTTRSRSLALHALATDPSESVGAALRQRLITAAVADDPGNGLARLADLDRLGTGATREDQERVAKAALREHALLRKREDEKDHVALSLRLLFVTAAARLNAALVAANAGGCSDADRRAARDAVAALVDHVAKVGAEAGSTLKTQLEQASAYLVLGTGALRPSAAASGRASASVSEAWKKCVETAERWKPSDDTPLGAAGAYDRACWRCQTKTPLVPGGRVWQEAVLDDLVIAASDDALRRWARVDPSLENLRRSADDSWTRKFRELVGDPPPKDVLHVAPLDAHRSALAAIGVHSAADLLALSPEVARERLGVDPQILRGWKDLARLALPESGAKAVPAALVAALAAEDVRSRAALRKEVTKNEKCLHDKMVEATRDLAFLPDARAWSSYAGFTSWLRFLRS